MQSVFYKDKKCPGIIDREQKNLEGIGNLRGLDGKGVLHTPLLRIAPNFRAYAIRPYAPVWLNIVGADPCVGPGIATIFQNRANIAFGGTNTWVCPYGYAKTVFTAPARFSLPR